jgi:hypothetical protein
MSQNRGAPSQASDSVARLFLYCFLSLSVSKEKNVKALVDTSKKIEAVNVRSNDRNTE